MTFLWPTLLWTLLMIPILVAVYVWAQRRRQKYALRFASLSLVKQAMLQGPSWRRHIPPALTFAALAVLSFALARPTASVPLLAHNGLIVLALDISGSMRARDVSPSRIEAAQAAAKTFVDKQSADSRMALITFAATASLVQAPTDDKGQLNSAIQRVAVQRGTAIGSGIVMALNTILEDQGEKPLPFSFAGPQAGLGGGGFFGDSGFGGPPTPPPPLPDTPGPALDSDVIVLLSDGQSNVGPDPLSVVPLAVQRKVRIYTIGLGDPNGVVLNAFNRRARVSLDEATLKEIALQTKADYFRAGTDTDLKAIYEKLSTGLVIKQEKVELTALLSALAAVLVLVSGGLSLFWFNRFP